MEFDEVAFRYSNYDTPFWVRPNSEPGRWHRVGDGPTQYLSASVEGAWAELIRAEGLRTESEVALVRMPIWVAEVQVHWIADYGSFQKAEEAGFAPDALIDDDFARCQEEGRRLRRAGFQGILAPSAALPGSLNLTLFGPRIASTLQLRSLLASSIPAMKVAVGAPPEGVVERVRQRGERHSLYEEFRAGVPARRRTSEENWGPSGSDG
ncbi:MAG: RES family NAD+ phosphorylase [Solirubrobacterales bacterium]